MEWSQRQAQQSQENAEFDDFEINVERQGTLNGLDAAFDSGRSPMTEFQYVNVRCYQSIWFIWASIGPSDPDEIQ